MMLSRSDKYVLFVLIALALLVAGVQMIWLPRAPQAASLEAEVININTASKQELMRLPGVGEVLAQRIIEYREAHGGFKALEELMNVKGIGPKLLEKIKDRIKVH